MTLGGSDDADLRAILSDTGEFGAQAIYNGATIVFGIFDDEDVEVQGPDGPAVIMPQITFGCAISDIPDVSDGDTLEIAGRSYVVRSWKRDGEAYVDLFLEDVTL